MNPNPTMAPFSIFALYSADADAPGLLVPRFSPHRHRPLSLRLRLAEAGLVRASRAGADLRRLVGAPRQRPGGDLPEGGDPAPRLPAAGGGAGRADAGHVAHPGLHDPAGVAARLLHGAELPAGGELHVRRRLL